jgi:hypothetical protein
MASAFTGLYSTVRGAAPQDVEKLPGQSQLFMRVDAMSKKHLSESCFLAFLLFLAFGTSSITQFLSLLSFEGPKSLCSAYNASQQSSEN